MVNELIDQVIGILPDPFIFSYICGILILMFFAAERLDAPLRARRRAKFSEAIAAKFDDFIHKLPPSSLRVRRYFVIAWLIYCLGLVFLFTVLCFLVALAVQSATPEQAGLDKLLTIAPGADAARVGNTLADSVGNVFPVSTIAPDHPWQPIIIALAMSGVLPIVPRVRSLEQRIRQLSLSTAGIPSQVFKLWENLQVTDLGFERTIGALADTDVYEKADRYYQMLGPGKQPQISQFREALAIIAAFKAWGQDPEPFPSREIRQLFDSAAPRDLETDVDFLIHDIAYQVRLSDALVEQRPVLPAQADMSGLAERGGEFRHYAERGERRPVPGRNVAHARDTLSDRWQQIAEKTIQDSKVCSLLIALYVERSPRMDGKHAKSKLLRTWITEARQRMAAASVSFNYFLFANLFVALPLSCLLLYAGAVHWIVSLVLGSDVQQITGESGSVQSDAMEQLRVAVWSAPFLFLPAAMPLFMFREVWVAEARWRHWVQVFEPPLLQYIAFFISAITMSAAFQMLYLYIEPLLVPGSQRSLRRIDEFITRSTIETAGFRGISGGMLATIIALALDQRFRKDNLHTLNWSIIVGFSLVAMPVALSFLPGHNILWWDDTKRLKEGIEPGMLHDTYLLTITLSSVAVFTLLMMILYSRNKLKKSQAEARAMAKADPGAEANSG